MANEFSDRTIAALNDLKAAIEKSRRIVVLTGAGASVPSGIPDFRSAHGLYSTPFGNYPAETVISHDFFLSHPKEFYDFYKSKIISDGVFYDTIKDVAVWCENNSNKGLKNYRWLHNHAAGNLFKIGRLQFQMYKAPVGLDYTKLPFKRGDNLLYIHIPQGEKLTKESCTDSVRRAEEFFRSHFPNYEYDYFFCESWLLFPDNRSFMANDSNIVKFMDLFTPAYSTENDSQAIERIFGERKSDINDYGENTSLQKRAKEYMLCGNKLGFGTGYIKKQ